MNGEINEKGIEYEYNKEQKCVNTIKYESEYAHGKKQKEK